MYQVWMTILFCKLHVIIPARPFCMRRVFGCIHLYIHVHIHTMYVMYMYIHVCSVGIYVLQQLVGELCTMLWYDLNYLWHFLLITN